MNQPRAIAPITGIVLVGTHPWNNSAFDQLVPRALLPVAHRPLISYALTWLADAGVCDVAICANRETRALQSRLARHVPRDMSMTYHEDPMPRGAGGSVRDAALASESDTFVVAEGTAIPNVSFRELLSAHRASGAAVTVVVHSEKRADGSTGLQTPTGIYVFSRRALDFVPPRGFCDIKETLIPLLHRSGERVAAYSTATPSPRVLGVPSYLAVNQWMVEKLVRSGKEHQEYLRLGESLVHHDSMIATGATLVGPVLIEAGARVMAGAVIVGPTSIGRDAIIAPGALVTRSAVWRRCKVQEHAIVDRCVLADDAAVSAHTKAFRDVVVAERRPVSGPVPAGAPSVALPNAMPVDLYRKVVRRLAGASWLRSPAT